MTGSSTGTRSANDQPSFEVSVEPHAPEVSTVVVRGEIDVATSPALRAVLTDPEQCPGPEVVVDLRAVTFLDSSGLSVLVATHNAVTARGGRVRLECGPGAVPLVLRASGLDQVFDVSIEDPAEGES